MSKSTFFILNYSSCRLSELRMKSLRPNSIPFSCEVHTLVWRQTTPFLSIINTSANYEVVFKLDHPVDFPEPVYYEFRVTGRLSQQGASWFEGMSLSVNEATTPPQTIIRGYVQDRSALHGLINRIRDMGLTLLSVQRVNGEQGTGQNNTQD
jgi:hypothetical protein